MVHSKEVIVEGGGAVQEMSIYQEVGQIKEPGGGWCTQRVVMRRVSATPVPEGAKDGRMAGPPHIVSCWGRGT